MASWNLLYDLYERRLSKQLEHMPVPRHVGVILDGNRRWAKAVGTSTSHGHRAGANRIVDLLDWADDAGVEIVTLWMLSTDNLDRDAAELKPLLDIIAETVSDLAASKRWRIKLVGDASILPESLATVLADAEDATADVGGLTVNVAVGYGGRREIADAVKELLTEAAAEGRTLQDVAASLTDEDISDHLYTKGQPDPDLVIRTSGEQRLSGFMLWQSVHTEFYFTDAYWPDFRRVDFLRALRSYGQRERRMGR